MIRTMILTAGFLFSFMKVILAQSSGQTQRSELKQLVLGEDLTVHLVSPEPIRYVDLSSHRVVGDLPLVNVLRIRVLPDSSDTGFTIGPDLGILTVVGERYMAQYTLRGMDGTSGVQVPTRIDIRPDNARPIALAEVGMSTGEMAVLAGSIIRGNPAAKKAIRRADAYGIRLQLNAVHTSGEYIFLDIGFANRTNIPYSLDELRLTVDDRKIRKATNVQSIAVEPRWHLVPPDKLPIDGRTVLVLDKLTFPENKVLNIRLTETQVSGRTVTLRVKYRDILRAKPI